MTPEQLRKALAKGQPAPAYFLPGPETLMKGEALDAVAAIVPEAERDFNVQVFHAFKTDFVDVVNAARTLPFLGPRRVVILRDVEKTRLDQAGRGELLDEYLTAPAPETVFVVTTEDDAKAKTLVKQHGGAWAVEVRAPPRATRSRARAREAARLGCAITKRPRGAGRDRRRTGRGSQRTGETARLALGDGGAIDDAAVARYAAGYEHHESFDIVDPISRRDLTAACG